jgi:hypothetical protein
MSMGEFAGHLKSYSMAEFNEPADRILRKAKMRGSYTGLFVTEPNSHAWGGTQEELQQNVIEAVSTAITPMEGLTYSKDFEKDHKMVPVSTAGYPEIQKAFNEDRVFLLVGQQPNGHRVAAVLTLESGTPGLSNPLSQTNGSISAIRTPSQQRMGLFGLVKKLFGNRRGSR